VHSGLILFWWLIHLSVSSLAAKGKGATALDGKQGRAQRVHFTLVFWPETVLRKALRVRAGRGDGSPEQQTECTHPTRRNVGAALKRRFTGAVKAWANGPQQGLTWLLPSDPSESPKPARGSAETGRCRAAARRSGADDPAGTDGEPKGAIALTGLWWKRITIRYRHHESRHNRENIRKV